MPGDSGADPEVRGLATMHTADVRSPLYARRLASVNVTRCTMSNQRPAYPIAPASAEDLPAFERATALAFGETLDDDEVAHYVELSDADRTLVARDGDLIVATTQHIDFTVSVPFAPPVWCPGITSVGVRPTHRRRGILTSLMRHQIDDLRGRGAAWAALYASEAAIYGRFGFGVASRSVNFAIERPWGGFDHRDAPLEAELLDAEQALARVPAVYEAARATVPGMMSSPELWWRHRLQWDPASDRDGASQRFIVAVGDRAYALYRVKQAWSDTGPDSTLRIEECVAADPAAYRQLWAYLFGVDLVQRVTADQMAVDDPLPWWLRDRTKLRITEGIPGYVRLIDVGAALSQRGTRATGAVVLDVTDAFCPANAGRWRLTGDGAMLRAERADAPADVALDVRELASLSLGGVSASQLVHAGVVEERTSGARQRLDALLASDRAAWNPFIY